MSSISIPVVSESSTSRWHRGETLMLLVLALWTFGIYFQSWQFNFINFDDHAYVTDNQHVLKGLTFSTFRWAMTAIVVGNWHPLTVLAELLLVSLFGPSAGAFHMANAVLHTVNVTLLFIFLRKSTQRLWPAFLAAGLWGLHPLRVESVAWISELKDVLCGALWLGCMLAYLHYSRRRSLGRYGIVLMFQILALLAKPMAGTLPAALLLLDFWPIQEKAGVEKDVRWWTARVLEKLPLLLVCVADLAYAVATQRPFLGSETAVFPFALRLKNAVVSIVCYLGDLFFPHNLLMFHTHPGLTDQTIPMLWVVLFVVLLLAITVATLLLWKQKPYLITGWLWFLGTLVPVLGLVRLGDIARADRYTYLPSIGIIFALVWLVSDWFLVRPRLQTAGLVAGVVLMGVLSTLSARDIAHWKDDQTLFDYVLQIQPDNPLGLDMQIGLLLSKGQVDKAVHIGSRAVASTPHYAGGHVAYAEALQAAGKLPEAEDQFDWALRIMPAEEDFWTAKGVARVLQASAYAKVKDPLENVYRQKAIIDFQTALRLDSESPGALEDLALEYAALGRMDQAISTWDQLLTFMPNNAQAQGDYADALRLTQDLPGAVQHYKAALNNGATNPDWETELAYLVATNPQMTAADVQPMVAIAKDACDQTHNRSAAALDAYAACLARVGRFDDAVTAATQGIAQANAAHQPEVAAGMQKRLALYQQELPYVVSDGGSAVTQPIQGPPIPSK